MEELEGQKTIMVRHDDTVQDWQLFGWTGKSAYMNTTFSFKLSTTQNFKFC